MTKKHSPLSIISSEYEAEGYYRDVLLMAMLQLRQEDIVIWGRARGQQRLQNQIDLGVYPCLHGQPLHHLTTQGMCLTDTASLAEPTYVIFHFTHHVSQEQAEDAAPLLHDAHEGSFLFRRDFLLFHRS